MPMTPSVVSSQSLSDGSVSIMTAPAHKHARSLRNSRGRAFIFVLLLSLLVSLSGCALSLTDRADEAYKKGEYTRAIELYEEAIGEGNRDPELFYRAAQASLKVGDLAGAERYYSRSIRYGGGVTVMRALAQLYIQTSNYTRAVQVLYELLNYDTDQQPIYNNLGTSLMYAGSPFEAESFLLVAQQMDPKDPVPYVNLGLLYDRYMKQVDLGAEFYQCYLSLSSPKAEQRRQIMLRLKELGVSPSAQGPERVVICGEVYTPRAQGGPDPSKLRAALGVEEDEGKETPKTIELGVNGDQKTGENNAPPTVETSGGKTTPPTEKTSPVVVSTEGASPEQDAREKARERYDKAEYEAAARALETIPIEKITAEDARLMARVQNALEQPLDAETWWRLSLERKPSAIALGELLKLMRAQKRTSDMKALCSEYEGREELSPVAHYCPR